MLKSAKSSADVALINMPFVSVFWPSIALGLLKATLGAAGIRSTVCYFNVEFARRYGLAIYEEVERKAPSLLGDWLFASELYGRDDDSAQTFIDDVLIKNGVIGPSRIEAILALRGEVKSFINDCADHVLSYEPRVIGFTSVFQQHVASLALAKALKERSPHLTIVIGGANCEGSMGIDLLDQFNFLDVVVSGEGEEAIVSIAKSALAGTSPSQAPGVRVRRRDGEPQHPRSLRSVSAGITTDNTPMIQDLNSLPTPDYDDYYDAYNASGFEDEPYMSFETSRGCWWGERSHCTFCSLNGQTMTYRSKSPERAMDELTQLVGKYNARRVAVVDNILDMKYFKTFIPALARSGLKLELFYEVKSNLSKSMLRQLKGAGISRIQPGIESFSDSVLALMRKGVSGIQNVQLLKWCRELGIKVEWNFLYGFPGEDASAYSQMADSIPLLTHLAPPYSATPVSLQRYSPLFREREMYFTNVQPAPSYSHVYAVPDDALDRMAYYFTYDYKHPDYARDEHVELLKKRVSEWIENHSSAGLFFFRSRGSLRVFDLRPSAPTLFTELSHTAKDVFLACDTASSVDTIARAIFVTVTSESVKTVEAILVDLVSKQLVFCDGKKFLALAIPVGEFVLNAALAEQLVAKVTGSLDPCILDALMDSIESQSEGGLVALPA